MQILLISPYHGGSHQEWAAGYQTHSKHQVQLLTLPARFWKWRMHGGAITLARRFLEQDYSPDIILATDMLDLTTFLALTRKKTAGIPVLLYMHENQLTYPLPADGSSGPMRRQLGERDRHYAFINYASMMAADRIFFNSSYHLNSFFAALPNFLKHFPEFNEMNSLEKLQAKSRILPVGINLGRLDLAGQSETKKNGDNPPLILWNQRWEYDKNPEGFFAALYSVADQGIPFHLALCGQQYGRQPAVFAEATEKLGDRIIHKGYATPPNYANLLRSADITISTAHHEFFGISIVEAIYANTFPILPNRLSYPEIIPANFHERCLYENQVALVERVNWAISSIDRTREIAAELRQIMAKYDWTKLAGQYDLALQEAAKSAI